MMLRSRNVNNANIVNNNKDGLQKRGIKKPLTEISQNPTEPKAKKQALNDIFQRIENFAIDSAKKGPERRKRSDSDALPSINENIASQEETDPCPHYDFDKEVAADVNAVSEYAADIFKYYKNREKVFPVRDYMVDQRITKLNRASLVDWMVEIQETFELNHETFYLAVKLIDLYLSKQVVGCEELQILACGALWIASKFDERSPPLLDDFVYMAEDTFTRDQLIKVEMKMLDVIGYDLGAPLSYRYLRRYSRVIHGDMETLTLARFLLETTMMFYDFVTESDSKLAAAVFLLSLKMKNQEASWTDVLYKYSGYKEEDLLSLMAKVNHAMHIRPKGAYQKLQTILSKYSHEVFYKSAAVPLLPDFLTSALQ